MPDSTDTRLTGLPPGWEVTSNKAAYFYRVEHFVQTCDEVAVTVVCCRLDGLVSISGYRGPEHMDDDLWGAGDAPAEVVMHVIQVARRMGDAAGEAAPNPTRPYTRNDG